MSHDFAVNFDEDNPECAGETRDTNTPRHKDTKGVVFAKLERDFSSWSVLRTPLSSFMGGDGTGTGGGTTCTQILDAASYSQCHVQGS